MNIKLYAGGKSLTKVSVEMTRKLLVTSKHTTVHSTAQRTSGLKSKKKNLSDIKKKKNIWLISLGLKPKKQ